MKKRLQQLDCAHMQSKWVKCADKALLQEGTDEQNDTEQDAFQWQEARFVSVVVFSHAVATLLLKEGGLSLKSGSKPLSAKLAIASLKQGEQELTLPLAREGEEVCAVVCNSF